MGGSLVSVCTRAQEAAAAGAGGSAAAAAGVAAAAVAAAAAAVLPVKSDPSKETHGHVKERYVCQIEDDLG